MPDFTRVLAECLALTYSPNLLRVIENIPPEGLQKVFIENSSVLTELAEAALRPMAHAAFEHVDWETFASVYRQALDQIASSTK